MKKPVSKTRIPPFKDPKIRAKAQAASKGKPRPNRKSKAKLVQEAKKEIIKDQLIKDGYLDEIRASLPKVYKAHLKVASTPRASATAERKLLFEAIGLKEKDKSDVGTTIGQVLAELANGN